MWDPFRSLSNPARRALQGALLGPAAPLGWLALRLFSGARPSGELAGSWSLYGYMLLGAVAAFALFGWLLGRREAELAAFRMRDALTALYNPPYFHEQLRQRCEQAKSRGGELGLLVVDLDRFRTVNERFGHDVGDELLANIARTIHARIRPGDTVGRLGGEAFGVVLPDCAPTDIRGVGERIRKSVTDRASIAGSQRGLGVTASVGAAWYSPHLADGRRIYQLADEALFTAKEAGRNCVWLADEPAPEMLASDADLPPNDPHPPARANDGESPPE